MSSNDNEKVSSESGVERGVPNAPPILANNESLSIASTDGASSSSYAAELVQSAARSLLDTSATLLSDDESEEQASSCAALSSLQTETLPALPNVQDRKRFIGCLASILASSYDYDFDDSDAHENPIDFQTAASFHLYNVDDSDDDEEEDYKSQSDEQDESDNSSFRLEEEERVEFSSDEDKKEQAKPPPIRRQEQPQSPTTPQSNSNPLSFSIMRKDKNLIERARIRHRRRRYDLFSNLLVSASDLLLLDKSHAKAFIPMLRSLLTPPKREATEEPNLKQSESMGGWLRRATTMTLPTSSSMDDPSSPGGYKSDPGDVLEQSEDSSDETEEVLPVTTSDFDDEDRYFLLRDLNDSDILKAFLESLSPGAGFRCLSLMLLQHLLRSEQGYDARVRHVFKKLGVIVLVHEMEREQYSFGPDGEKIQLLTNSELAQLATRKFEALEHGIAAKLIQLSEVQQKDNRGTRKAKASTSEGSKRQLKRGISREQLVRGLKVGSAGVVAGTLFAVTGGLAAPGIAAGIAALAGGAAATAAVVTLTSTATVTAIFGVGGGGLAAYKMQRRTQGLTEFKFQKESRSRRRRLKGLGEKTRIDPELFSTICISGWLRDYCDFQRPWGVSPSNPPITDRLELLERFYSVHNPDHVSRCSKILSKWKNEEDSLWRLLKKKYGRDPDELFPIEEGIRQRGSLTLEEDEVLDQLFVELGHISFLDEEASSMWKSSFKSRRETINEESPPRRSNMFRRQARSTSLEDSLRGSRQGSVVGENVTDADSDLISGFGNSAAITKPESNKNGQKEKERSSPKHLLTVWDYQAHYGGELYTIKWESRLLMELCDSVTDMAVDFLENATRQILKTTALSTLLTAVAVPTVMLQAMNVIDGSWTLAIERADEAGKELAKSLLFSRAGHRPVTLVGFSMGARVIYSCLKELAKYQEKWEDAREAKPQPQPASTGRRTKKESADKKQADDDIEVYEGMREPASIVEDAIIMGLPNHMNLTSWEACRQIVGGRLINCYSRKDLILSLMFQSKKITSGLKKVCGTCAIDVPGVENYDVTDLVNGHQDYCFTAGDILKRVRHGQPIRRKQGSNVQAVGGEDTEAV